MYVKRLRAISIDRELDKYFYFYYYYNVTSSPASPVPVGSCLSHLLVQYLSGPVCLICIFVLLLYW